MFRLDWWYIRDGLIYGPATLGTVRRLIESGELTQRELVWQDGLQRWTPIFRMETLRPFLPRQHDIYRRPNDYSLPPLPTRTMRCSAHPGVRFLAQLLDLAIVALLIFGVAPVFGWELRFPYDQSQMSVFIRTSCTVALALFVQAPMLALWGTTPAKFVLGLRVLTRQGTLPDIGDALQRQLYLFVVGTCLGTKAFFYAGVYYAFKRRMAGRHTFWDTHAGTGVYGRSQPVHTGRVMLAIGFLVMIAILYPMLSMTA